MLIAFAIQRGSQLDDCQRQLPLMKTYRWTSIDI